MFLTLKIDFNLYKETFYDAYIWNKAKCKDKSWLHLWLVWIALHFPNSFFKNFFFLSTIVIVMIIIIMSTVTNEMKPAARLSYCHRFSRWNNEQRMALNYNIYLLNYYTTTMTKCLNRLEIKKGLSRSSCNKKISWVKNLQRSCYIIYWQCLNPNSWY